MAKANYKFDPFTFIGLKKPDDPSVRREALQAMGEFLRDSVLDHVADSKSPVSGGPWKKALSKAYKDVISDFSSVLRANLELSGSMLDALDFKIEGDQINFGVFDDNLVGRAEGNNIGSYGQGRGNRSKARRFIPLSREKFNPEIRSGMRNIAEDIIGEEDV